MGRQRQFLGESADERRARRRTQLIDAALDQVTEAGFGSASVRGICSRAGLTSRYFYESFANLDELFSTLLDDVADTVLSAGAEAVSAAQDAPPRERIHRGLSAAIDAILDDPRRTALIAAVGAGDPSLQRKRLDIVLRLVDSINADPVSVPAPEQGSSALTLFLAGGALETIFGVADGRLDITRDQLVDHLTDFTIGTTLAAAGHGR
ncbi:TetR/AcrR family transcriptional regulator [Gordonia sp. VNK21]|uniref:TetR/AcrR family transcriptional regulator n=1 Tax=Gordonia sp. VNK21 TaxID=3382483 RepID=UPI0038D3BBE3